jgi:hypothetical protein
MNSRDSAHPTQENEDLFDFDESSSGKLIHMNSIRQFTDQNNTIDGFYADHDKEYAEDPIVPTQLSPGFSDYILQSDNNHSSRILASFNTPQMSNENNPHDIGPSSSSFTPVTFGGIQEHDEYLTLHYKCLSGGKKGKKMSALLVENYRSVIYAMCGCKIFDSYSKMDNDEKYRKTFDFAKSLLENNGRLLIGNTFGIFNKLPDYELPSGFMELLVINMDNYGPKRSKDAPPITNVDVFLGN